MPVLGDSGSASLVFGVGALLAYLAMLWIALAFYVLRDARRRSASMVFVGFAALLGFIPPFLGALVYLVIRPPRTLEEERTLALEELALAEPIPTGPEVRPCPSCGRDIDADFVICPYCRTQFSRCCVKCDRVLRLGWGVCPYCATDVGAQTLKQSSRSSA